MGKRSPFPVVLPPSSYDSGTLSCHSASLPVILSLFPVILSPLFCHSEPPKAVKNLVPCPFALELRTRFFEKKRSFFSSVMTEGTVRYIICLLTYLLPSCLC